MSFSHPDFASFVEDRFEPVWQSVRDVPRITLDFGATDGGEPTVVRRTLHGNVATYVCLADGLVVDIVPGLYDRTTYRTRLNEAAALAERIAARPAPERAAAVRAHHAGRLAAGRATQDRAGRVQRPGAGGASKSRIELPVEETVTRGAPPPDVADGAKRAAEAPVERASLRHRTPLDLTRDTANNDANRRPAVHRLLAAEERPTVPGLTKRVYRDVLGTDLDDPYLGLAETLFATYPFGD